MRLVRYETNILRNETVIFNLPVVTIINIIKFLNCHGNCSSFFSHCRFKQLLMLITRYIDFICILKIKFLESQLYLIK
jgi:hypothetical protein